MGNLKNGYIQIYTGNGKGKTTAAVGLATRAAGNKYRVCMVQFLKGGVTGELESAKLMAPYFTIHRFERPRGFFWTLNEQEKLELKEDIDSNIVFTDVDKISSRIEHGVKVKEIDKNHVGKRVIPIQGHVKINTINKTISSSIENNNIQNETRKSKNDNMLIENDNNHTHSPVNCITRS